MLHAVAESMAYVRAVKPEWCFVHLDSKHLRLLAGRLIVLTMERDRLWISTGPSHSSILSALPSWRWDVEDYPEYRRVPSRNGYYSQDFDSGDDWPAIWQAHRAYLDEVLAGGVAPDPRSRKHHEDELMAYLDGLVREQSEPTDRARYHGLSSPPTADEYTRALLALGEKVTERHRELLRVHYEAPGREATAKELAVSAGLASHALVNAAYGKLGHAISDFLETIPSIRRSGDPRWWTLLSSGRRTSRGYLWRMLPAVAEALERLGWVAWAGGSFSLPEEVPATYPEGAKKRITVNAYERDDRARRQCVEDQGSVCIVCTFDFGKTYGPIAAGYIHVHHIEPLANPNVQHDTNPKIDLSPVCPNCHAVIHLRRPPYSPDEVRELLKLYKGSLE